MKKIFLTTLMIIGTTVLIAQPLPPTGHAGQGDVIGGAAPIDGGISIFIALGAAFGFKKILKLKIRN